MTIIAPEIVIEALAYGGDIKGKGSPIKNKKDVTQ